jgi:hypothetical protein
MDNISKELIEITRDGIIDEIASMLENQ